MSDYTRHHFVPQFCLREFANDAGRKRIGTYLVQDEHYIASTSIRAQAQRKKLYGSEQREKTLSEIEGAAAVVLRRMVNGFEVPSRHSEDHSTLLVHVLFQASRTPTAAAELEEGMDQMAKMMLSHDERVAPYLEFVQLKFHDGAIHTLAHAARALPLAFDLQYKLLLNRTKLPFILSDHPVVKYNQFMERRKVDLGCTGFASKGLQMFLPVSPRVALLMYDGDTYRVGRSAGNNVVEVNGADVDALNILQVINAGSQLFFNHEMSEDMVWDLVRRSQPGMRETRSTIRELPQPPTEPDTLRSFVITSLKDIRVGLKLACVVELPSAQAFRLRDGTSLLRDPRLCQLHDDFGTRVSAGLYGPGDFDRYWNDVNHNRVRQFFEAV